MPYLPWEPEYEWKSYSPLTHHSLPKWHAMIFFSGTWEVRYSRSQKNKGRIYRDALQRSESGAWISRDEEIVKAFDFLRTLVRCNLTAIKGRLTLAELQKYDFLQSGLWEGLLPALLKGRFAEIENAWAFARQVESERVIKDRFAVENQFPFAVTPYQKGLIGVCKEMRDQTKATPPSVSELFEFMNKNDLLGPNSMSDAKFRENLKKLGLEWLIESRKK
jgi:hypothetical protein